MKTILVVDDEQALVVAIQLVLESEGFKVLSAATGEQALQLAQKQPPDVILMDIMMPGIGGLETLATLRSHPDFLKTPVILMSSVRPLASRSKYSWDDFLDKPFTDVQMLDALAKHL